MVFESGKSSLRVLMPNAEISKNGEIVQNEMNCERLFLGYQ